MNWEITQNCADLVCTEVAWKKQVRSSIRSDVKGVINAVHPWHHSDPSCLPYLATILLYGASFFVSKGEVLVQFITGSVQMLAKYNLYKMVIQKGQWKSYSSQSYWRYFENAYCLLQKVISLLRNQVYTSTVQSCRIASLSNRDTTNTIGLI